jgi:hypothetical protein
LQESDCMTVLIVCNRDDFENKIFVKTVIQSYSYHHQRRVATIMRDDVS